MPTFSQRPGNSVQELYNFVKAMNRQPNDSSHTVYYDGSCPMCRVLIGKIDDSSKGEKFLMRDITKESLPPEFAKTDIEKEIHIITDGKIYKNSEAILKILEEYPAWKPFVLIGRLPFIRRILPFGYNFVAANRHFLFGVASRIYWLKVVVGLGFILGLLFSLKLWVSSRFYPLTPLLDIFPPIPYPFDWLVLLTLFGLLSATIMSSKPKRFVWASVAAVLILAFLDQQRLQPWVYQYTFMLATLGLFSWKWNDIEGRNAALNVSRFIVASIYFWSGLQKLNIVFIGGIFPWMVSPVAQFFPEPAQPTFLLFGLFVPFIEMGIGIGLLTRKFRNVAIGLALGMCAFVLWALGPFGHDWNSVVWPWNITTILLVFVLFIKTDSVPLRDVLWVKNYAFHKIILIVFGILPLLYFFNAWDSYLSWSLYSGTTNTSKIYVSNQVKERLPNYVQQFVRLDSHDRNVLSISDWAFTEFNVPPYPETRIFKNIAQSICESANSPNEVVLVMRGRLSWFYRDGQQTLNCAQL